MELEAQASKALAGGGGWGGAGSPGNARSSVWHLHLRSFQGLWMFWPVKMWELGGNANLAS